MAAGFRSQANLQLLLAEKFLSQWRRGGDSDAWGDLLAQAMAEAALFRLQLAYRCHLADLLEQQQLPGRFQSATEALAGLGDQQSRVPELNELQDREHYDDWLRRLLNHEFLPESAPLSAPMSSDMLAVERAGAPSLPTLPELADSLESLRALITRHRDTYFEY